MPRAFNFLILLACVSVALCGCVAPGSSVGRISVIGELVTIGGEPVSGEEIQIVLPATYGLGGLDQFFGEPEDYGNSTKSFDLNTDSNGIFEQPLGELVYHVSFWLLPPLGGFPRNPPPPFLLFRLPNRSEEIYAVETWSGEYKAFDRNGEELRNSELSISEIRTRIEHFDGDKFRETRASLTFKIIDPE